MRPPISVAQFAKVKAFEFPEGTTVMGWHQTCVTGRSVCCVNANDPSQLFGSRRCSVHDEAIMRRAVQASMV